MPTPSQSHAELVVEVLRGAESVSDPSELYRTLATYLCRELGADTATVGPTLSPFTERHVVGADPEEFERGRREIVSAPETHRIVLERADRAALRLETLGATYEALPLARTHPGWRPMAAAARLTGARPLSVVVARERGSRYFSETEQETLTALLPALAIIDAAIGDDAGGIRENASSEVRHSLWEELVRRSRRVADGHAPSPATDGPAERGEPRLQLTHRQGQICHHLALGHTNKEIASALDISPHTVRNHLVALFARFGVSTRAELVALLIRGGAMPSGEKP